MSDDPTKKLTKLTAYYILGSTARKQQEKREEIQKKIVENVRSMSEDEIQQLRDMCSADEAKMLDALLAEARRQK
jgi:hypothetical protein